MELSTQEKIVKSLETAYVNASDEIEKLGKVKRYKIGDREMEYLDFMKYYANLRDAYERESKKLAEMKSRNTFNGAAFLEIRQET